MFCGSIFFWNIFWKILNMYLFFLFGIIIFMEYLNDILKIDNYIVFYK